MEIVTDKNILKAFEEEELKDKLNIKDGAIVTDPKVLLQFEEAEKKDIVKKDGFFSKEDGFYQKYIDGDGRTEFKDLPEIGQFNLLKEDGTPDNARAMAIAVGISLTPSVEAQIDIIKKNVPGAIATRDKFNNVVMSIPKKNGGQTFYLNKPGISQQDILQGATQVMQFIPGAGLVARNVGGGIIKKGVAQGVMATGTSVVQDVGAGLVGSKQGIEGDKAAISFAGGFIAEPIGRFLTSFGKPIVKYGAEKIGKGVDKILPDKGVFKLFPDGIAASELNIFSGSGQYLNSKGYVTKKAKEMAFKQGIDSKLVDENVLKEFAQALEYGVEPNIAKELVGANGFGISLWKAQASGDKAALKKIQAIREGGYGPEAADIVAKQDEIQIGQSLKWLEGYRQKLLGKTQPSSTSPMGEKVGEDESITYLTSLIKNLEQKQSNIISQKYSAINWDGSFKAPVMKKFTRNIKNILEDSTDGIGMIPDSTLTPFSSKAMSSLEKFAKQYSKKGKKITNITIKNLENERKRINSFISNSKEPIDRKGLFIIKKQYDTFMQETIEKGLAGGDKKVLEAIAAARASQRKYGDMFNPNDVLKKGGKLKDKGGAFIQDVLRGDYTPNQIANFIYGNASTGKAFTKTSVDVVNRLGKLFPKGSEGFDVLKDGSFIRLVNSGFKETSGKKRFDPELFIKTVNDAMDGKGRDISKLIYSKVEMEESKSFAKQLQKTLTPEDLINPSKTASSMMALMNKGFIRSGVKVAAFKGGGLNAMLMAAFGFDTVVGAAANRVARRTVMEAIDINSLPTVTGFQGLINQTKEQRPILQGNKTYNGNVLDQTSDVMKLLEEQ